MISPMSEKSMKSSKFIFCLTTISMSILILSSIFLLQSSTSIIAGSVFKQIFVNNASTYFRPNTNNNDNRSYIGTNGSHGSDPSKVIVAVRKEKRKACEPSAALLRVYMYDLPPQFHFGLLGWKGKDNQIWPNVANRNRLPPYPGGLNLQHSIEYWLTLDILSSNNSGIIRPSSAVRVENSSQADVIFVPFFSSLSYNRYSRSHGRRKVSVNRMLQDKLVQFLMSRDEWKRRDGKDHIIVAHHPNSMVNVRRKLGSAMFVLADFGRYSSEIANLDKDLIAPYRHMVRSIADDKAGFDRRTILVYFQGAIYRKDGGAIRQELYYLLKDEKDVHFVFGTAHGKGINMAGQGMASSKFCLNIAGDTPSSNRLFDAISSHCVPVIISDEIELPFEDVLDYSEFSIFVRASDSIKKGFLMKLLRGIKRDKWTKMWKRLQEVAQHFEYQYPSQPGDAVNMIWEAVSFPAKYLLTRLDFTWKIDSIDISWCKRFNRIANILLKVLRRFVPYSSMHILAELVQFL